MPNKPPLNPDALEVAARALLAVQQPDVSADYAWNVQFDDGREELRKETAAAVSAYLASAQPELAARLDQAEQAIQRVREVHRPVDVEPSETICHACSTLRGNGDSLRYFPYKEWPCDTIRALDGDPRAEV